MCVTKPRMWGCHAALACVVGTDVAGMSASGPVYPCMPRVSELARRLFPDVQRRIATTSWAGRPGSFTMVTSTHTDARPDTLGRMQRSSNHGGIRLRNLPDQWLLIEVDPPAAGLDDLRIRHRGRVITIDAQRPNDQMDELGVRQCTTRLVLARKPRGSIHAARDGGHPTIRVPLGRSPVDSTARDIRAIDGLAGAAAAGVAHARLEAATATLLPGGAVPSVIHASTRVPGQAPDVAPQRRGAVSDS